MLIHFSIGLWHTGVHRTRSDSPAGLWETCWLVGHGHHPIRVPGGMCPVLRWHTGKAVRTGGQRWVQMNLSALLTWETQIPIKGWGSCTDWLKIKPLEQDLIYCVLYADEIIWPDGDDALPVDAQDMIIRLLKQSPLERLGTGTWLLNCIWRLVFCG